MSSGARWTGPRSTASADSTRSAIPLSPSTFSHAARHLGRFVATGVDDKQDGAFGSLRPLVDRATYRGLQIVPLQRVFAVRRAGRRKYSTLPAGPGSGLAVTATACQFSSAARRATESTASTRNAGSDTTPPAPTRSLPTSNCGFTMGTISAPADAQDGQCGQHRRQRDERQVGDDEIDRAADGLGGEFADVGAFHDRHPRVGAQRPGQLAVADVDGDHLAGVARPAAPR